MRVAIVNDEKVTVEALRRIVLSNPRHQIAWIAENGEEAARACQRDLPDVILMDLIMPRVDGAEATRRIMRDSPCPILVVTAGVSRNFQLVCDALGAGAYDAICTPKLSDRPLSETGAELLAKMDQAEKVQRRLRETERPTAPRTESKSGPLVALGVSTGGPLALATILGSLPTPFPTPVLVVQHIDAQHACSLVDWLERRTGLKVRPAQAGDRPEPGVALLASSQDHLLLKPDRTLSYTPDPVEYPYRPSVNVLFESLAQHWPTPGVAALLTGIGSDGARGLLTLRQAGWETIAQDKHSCAVYGMPQAAQELGAAQHVLPLQEIGPFIVQSLSRKSRS